MRFSSSTAGRMPKAARDIAAAQPQPAARQRPRRWTTATSTTRAPLSPFLPPAARKKKSRSDHSWGKFPTCHYSSRLIHGDEAKDDDRREAERQEARTGAEGPA